MRTGRARRRRRVLALAAAAAVLLVTILTASPGNAGDMMVRTVVPNSGFELDLNNNQIPDWSYWPQGLASGLSLSDDDYAGLRSMSVQKTVLGSSLGVESARLAVTPGDPYEATIKLKVLSLAGTGGGTPQLFIRWFDGGGQLLNKDVITTVSSPELNTWLDVRVGGVAPFDAESAEIFIYVPAATQLTGLVDEAGFYRKADDNYLVNAGFEESSGASTPPGWDLYSAVQSPDSISVTTDPEAGSNYLEIVDDSDRSVGLYNEPVAVTGNATYKADLKARLVSGSQVVYIKFYSDTAGLNEVGSKSYGLTQPSLGWGNITFEATAPGTAKTARVLLYSATATTGTAYYDDVSLFTAGLDVPAAHNAPVDLGEATPLVIVKSAAINSAAKELYFAVNGSPAVFYAVDITTRQIKSKQQVPGTDVVWGITVAPDGDVYFASTKSRALYKYEPSTQVISSVGNNPSGNVVWDLDAGGTSTNGFIYGGISDTCETCTGKAFAYDIAHNTFTDYGTVAAGQKYVHSVGVSGQYLYAGTGAEKHLVRINTTNPSDRTEISVDDFTGQVGFVLNVWAYDGLLYVAHSSSLLVLEESSGLVRNRIASFDTVISSPYPGDATPTRLYYRNSATSELWVYDQVANVATKVPSIGLLPNKAVRAASWVDVDGSTKLVMMYEDGSFTFYDPAATSNQLQTTKLGVEPTGANIESLAKGPGTTKTYVGGFLGGTTVYDEVWKYFQYQEPEPFQIEEFGFLKGQTYLGAYPGARIYRYDPSAPYHYDGTANGNPVPIKSIGYEQDRPMAFASGGDNLFVGTVPEYRKLGGALAVYNEPAGTWAVYRNVVQDQSVVALAYRNGVVYGGTSIYGGLGSVPSATVAKMFTWNVATLDKTVFTPVIPGMATPRLIGHLLFDQSGLLYGAAWGDLDEGGQGFAIFKMAADGTNQVLDSEILYKNAPPGNTWRGFYLRWGADGLLYTTVGRNLTAFDPLDLSRYSKVVNSNVTFMDLGTDGSPGRQAIYYAQDSKLFKLPMSP